MFFGDARSGHARERCQRLHLEGNVRRILRSAQFVGAVFVKRTVFEGQLGTNVIFITAATP